MHLRHLLENLFLLHGVNDILVEDIIHCMEEGNAKTMKNLKKIDIPKPRIKRKTAVDRFLKKLTASILYKKGYPLAIQAILRHANPNTTARYIRSLGLEKTRGALEEGLKGPAQVIEFKKVNAV